MKASSSATRSATTWKGSATTPAWCSVVRIGRVVKASDNPMAAQLAAQAGMELQAAWVLVEFDDSIQLETKAAEVRRVKVQ